MLYELAITPQVFDDRLDCNDVEIGRQLKELLNEAGKSDPSNVLVTDLCNGRWERLVQEFLADRAEGNTWPPLIRKQLTAQLSKLRKDRRIVLRSLQGKQTPKTENEWLELARNEHLESALDWVLATPEITNHIEIDEPVIGTLPDFRQAEHWERRPTGTVVYNTRESMSLALRPLLKHARRLKVVDPFLDYWDIERDPNIVTIASSLLGMRGVNPRPGDIEIHVKDPRSRSESPDRSEPIERYIEGWHTAIAHVRSQAKLKHGFSLFIWQGRRDGQRFHQRYLLTDQCAVKLGDSINNIRLNSNEWDTWQLLSSNVREVLESTYLGKYSYCNGEDTVFRFVGGKRFFVR